MSWRYMGARGRRTVPLAMVAVKHADLLTLARATPTLVRVRKRALAALVSAACGSGCSLLLDFSDPLAPADAGAPDAIDPSACSFGEPNDTQATAFALSPVSGQAAGICASGDRDYYAITVADGQTLAFTAHFKQTTMSGDLDLKLLDAGGATVSQSLSADDDESITCMGDNPPCPALTAGTYVIEVYGFGNTEGNGYTIDFTLQ
jgi:hypothetical protein